MRINDIKISDNFHLREFECPCCQTVKLCPDLLGRLQSIRTKTGLPLIVISGYRYEKHNRTVNGAKNSQHLYGKAADIRIPRISIEMLYKLAEKYFPNDGIGKSRTTVHVDTRGRWARWKY